MKADGSGVFDFVPTSIDAGSVAVSSGASGSGFLTYSAQNVQTRFGASGTSGSFIAVLKPSAGCLCGRPAKPPSCAPAVTFLLPSILVLSSVGVVEDFLPDGREQNRRFLDKASNDDALDLGEA